MLRGVDDKMLKRNQYTVVIVEDKCCTDASVLDKLLVCLQLDCLTSPCPQICVNLGQNYSNEIQVVTKPPVGNVPNQLTGLLDTSL